MSVYHFDPKNANGKNTADKGTKGSTAPGPRKKEGGPRPAPSSEFKTVRHPNAKPGEWQGHYEPVAPTKKKPGSK